MTAPRTPGPWHYLDIGEVVSSDPVTGLPDPDDLICAVAGEDPIADGSLIAAAPALYEALERLFAVTVSLKFERNDDEPPIINDAAYDKALTLTRAALAKARGEQ